MMPNTLWFEAPLICIFPFQSNHQQSIIYEQLKELEENTFMGVHEKQ